MRRQSRLLAQCLAILTLLFIGIDLALSLSTPGYAPPWIGYAFLFGTFALNRAGHYRTAAATAMAMFSLVAFGLVYSGASKFPLLTLGYVALGPILGAIFLPVWGVVSLTFLNLVGMLLAPAFVPELAARPALLVGPLSMNAMVGVLASLYMQHRNAVEADRRRALLTEIDGRKQLQEQLREAQKMEALGRFAGGIAHDFNNVLTVILGNAALLRARQASAELSQIEAAATSAASLTRQLLAFGRRAVIEPVLLDVGQVVLDATVMMQRLIGEHIAIECDAVPGRDFARLDRAQLEQVLLNLATNARDAMAEGGTLRLAVSSAKPGLGTMPSSSGAAPGDHVRITVLDSGTGMDEATRARIFEPFFTTKERGRGTGLGLASVFGIVSQSQGSIEVASEPGEGTRFDLFFPRAEGATVPTSPRVRSAPAGGFERVLLVEDEEGVRRVVTLILGDAGYHVIEAGSLHEAEARWREHRADIALLITDLVLTDGAGADFALRLRSERPELPVLCMSGYGEGDVSGASALAHLQKPFSTAELLGRVRALLDGAAAAQGAAELSAQ